MHRHSIRFQTASGPLRSECIQSEANDNIDADFDGDDDKANDKEDERRNMTVVVDDGDESRSMFTWLPLNICFFF